MRTTGSSSTGSGVIIDKAGYIVTNNHVVEGAESIEVHFQDSTILKAELVGRDIGVSVDRRGYRFSRRNGAAWLPLEGDELRPREWLAGTQVALSSDGHAIVVGDDFPEKPQLACFSSGELTPFRLELRLTDLAQGWQLDGAPDATLKLAVVNVRAH